MTSQGPVLIEDDSAQAPLPAEVPPVPEPAPGPEGRAMQTVFALGARRPSRLTRWFWRSLWALLLFGLSLAAWNKVTALVASNAVLGGIALGLLGLVLFLALLMILREWAALARLSRIDDVKKAAESARAGGQLGDGRAVVARLMRLYAGRDSLSWQRQRVQERLDDVFDADAALELAEDTLLRPLDAAATQEVETAARQVATVTALVPLALADVVAALTANLRMIRRVAEIYGGRGGTLGSWRLARAVMAHLVATGAVAVGDDLLGSVAGGSVLSKISRRFGEGVVNGALTARVGVAAIEVCRPLAFHTLRRPSVSGIVGRALKGLFGRGSPAPE